MSNNNLNLETIKESLTKIIKDSNMLLSADLKDNNLTLVIETPKNNGFNPDESTKEINTLLKKSFPSLVDIRIVFSNKTPVKQNKNSIPNIDKVILLASAKGGVGKSTTATNIALALAKKGHRVGLVDADIYGPTIPKLLGICQKPETSSGKMLPIHKHGIYSMSIGYIVSEDQAAIWRGPMISKALYQLLLGVNWPKLDYLIIDMPPGTGDIYLSLAENFVIDGVMLVTTPQKIAFSMLKKSISFFNKTNIPIIGVIENMSFFFDESSNITHNLFGPSLTQQEVNDLGVDIIEKIALIPKISEFSDKGVLFNEEKEFEVYMKIAAHLHKWGN
jgi:ATP-binding protein involved in chromosome partitioning